MQMKQYYYSYMPLFSFFIIFIRFFTATLLFIFVLLLTHSNEKKTGSRAA